MRLIHNRIIPFKGFKAINLFGVLFVRKGQSLSEANLQHERIHTAQMREMLFIGFYLWYAVEWMIRFLSCFKAKQAYYNISFEKEAYTFQWSPSYLETREHFMWFKYL